jgi:hypothetical protein
MKNEFLKLVANLTVAGLISNNQLYQEFGCSDWVEYPRYNKDFPKQVLDWSNEDVYQFGSFLTRIGVTKTQRDIAKCLGEKLMTLAVECW